MSPLWEVFLYAFTVGLVCCQPPLNCNLQVGNDTQALILSYLQRLAERENDIRRLDGQIVELKQNNEKQERNLKNLKVKLDHLVDTPKPDEYNGGATYIRWGRTACPTSSGSKLVYKGYAAGSHHTQSGGGANYECLTNNPKWKYTHTPASVLREQVSLIYGAEYEAPNSWPFTTENVQWGPIYQHDVPCAACRTPGRSSVLMIPGTYQCPEGWQEEYHGYLTAERYRHYRKVYVCMDAAPEALTGGIKNENGALFYYTKARCGSLRCPPYIHDREITCVVCSIK